MPLDAHASRIANIKRGSEEGAAYVRTCRSLFNAIPLEYESREHVERIGTWLGERLESIWDQYATVPRPSRHSKSWWNAECSAVVKELRQLDGQRKVLTRQRRGWQARVIRAGHNFDLDWHWEVVRLTGAIAALSARIERAEKRMKGAVRRAKRQFFDDIMEKTHPSRIWDLVGWTKPRRLTTTTGLVDRDGQPADKPEQLASIFQEQFTPGTARAVDPSILDDIPQREERSFPAISCVEVRDALRDTSNFSAPGPDHASWFW
ncbi:hypothetical protein PHLGIDRAFT_68997, partial [Phlebiopsis gigantea 11061_1 CR5-6]